MPSGAQPALRPVGRFQEELLVVVLADVEAFEFEAAEVVGPLPPAAVGVPGGAGQLFLLVTGEAEDAAEAVVHHPSRHVRRSHLLEQGVRLRH
ncbi:hypothetical protein ACWGJB_29210 [Streptomyces sp. NPDC054813]